VNQSNQSSIVERAAIELAEREALRREFKTDWQLWLTTLFPRNFNKSFAKHHIEFWEWIESIQLGETQRPFFAVWARGAAKTTSAEAAVVRLGARGARKFCLYVRATQDKANESVQNIAALLESKSVEIYHPDLADRKLSKYGFAKGWRIDTLRCASGFSVVGLGFDAAVRGVKIEEDRPDLIVLDDIDSAQDTPKTVKKKIDILTQTILPAGAQDVVIVGVQNLIHGGGIFTQIVEGTADFLYHRTVSGPHPAVLNLEYEEKQEGGYKIIGGEPTWAGQDIPICEKQINEWGLTSFLREAQHELEQHGGPWSHIEFRRCDWGEVPDIIKGAVWVDPAVTSTDESDSMGIQADGLGVDNRLYRMYSWEQVISPEDALERAILKALELGFTTVGVETDQGGDTWRPTYLYTWEHMVQDGKVKKDAKMPTFKGAKAGAGHGSKMARNLRMLTDYEKGQVIHVRGTHRVLERALKRVPVKPWDLSDAAYWGWNDLAKGQKPGGRASRVRPPNTQHERQKKPQTVVLAYKGQRSFVMRDWHITPGWEKRLDKELAQRLAHKWPKYFEIKDE